MRLAIYAPAGGRAERDAATAPLAGQPGLDRGGTFMEINSGKLGMSLNLKSDAGRQLLTDLVRRSDVVLEGFSPGTMNRMGFGYGRLRELNPAVIYIQQSGFGEAGEYGRVRAYGPTAAALTGISEMSGLPDPFPPAGIGYSYLDWFGAYNMATATLAALYRREATGLGCHIDASQGEIGLELTGTAVLDYTVNGRPWARYGNRSPYKRAAPHGAYRTLGDDRWIAISAFTDEQWTALAGVLGVPSLADDPRFKGLDDRLASEAALDSIVSELTATWDGYELQNALQARAVPAGVCQTAQDRCERDPQLAHLRWLVELDQAHIGRWPVKDHPTAFSETPAHIGGPLDRSGPSYGQDTDRVLREVLGLDDESIAGLRARGII
jgi:crotonobetainyl-CoA:carnitine CoA-transferase CaiB-like acyl-CoA transferase